MFGNLHFCTFSGFLSIESVLLIAKCAACRDRTPTSYFLFIQKYNIWLIKTNCFICDNVQFHFQEVAAIYNVEEKM